MSTSLFFYLYFNCFSLSSMLHWYTLCRSCGCIVLRGFVALVLPGSNWFWTEWMKPACCEENMSRWSSCCSNYHFNGSGNHVCWLNYFNPDAQVRSLHGNGRFMLKIYYAIYYASALVPVTAKVTNFFFLWVPSNSCMLFGFNISPFSCQRIV